MSRLRLLVISLPALLVVASAVDAQPLGSFVWQLQPFCNNLTVNVTQQGALFTIDGYDDQCSAARRAPLVGVATQNPDGTIGFGLHIVTVPGGRAVDVDARIDLGTLSGPWSDSAGNSGTYAFNGRTGGTPRPLPTIPATALTPASITSTQIADGSITPQKLSVPLPKLTSSGLTTGIVSLTPNGTSVVVRTATMTIPTAGQVLVEASGQYGLTRGNLNQYAWCSISTGAAVETAHYMYARVDPEFTNVSNYVSNVPFAGSRVYSVTPGPFTVNLVCAGSISNNLPGNSHNIQTAQITALFVPS